MAVAPNAAAARALLEQARGCVEGYEPSALRSSKGQSNELWCSQQQLVDALKQGLIPADNVAEAAEVLRRCFRLHLAGVAELADADAPEVDWTTPSGAARAPGIDSDRPLPAPIGRWPAPARDPVPQTRQSRPHGPWAKTEATTDLLRTRRSDPARLGTARSAIPLSLPPPTRRVPPPPPDPLRGPPRSWERPPPGPRSSGFGGSAPPFCDLKSPDSSSGDADVVPSVDFTLAPESATEDALGSSTIDSPSPLLLTRFILNTLRVIGVELILFVLFSLYGTAVIQRQSQQSLNRSPAALHVAAPGVGLDLAVAAGDGRSNLGRGPGLMPGSGQLGGTRPIVIVGARTTAGAPFRYLGSLRQDDVVTLRQGERSVSFAVVHVSVTTPRGRLVVPPGPQVLYLVTANPPYSDHSRLVVTAQALGASRSQGSTAGAFVLPGLAGSPLRLVMSVYVLAALAIGWSLRRLWRDRLPAVVRCASWLPMVVGSYILWRLLLDGFSPLL